MQYSFTKESNFSLRRPSCIESLPVSADNYMKHVSENITNWPIKRPYICQYRDNIENGGRQLCNILLHMKKEISEHFESHPISKQNFPLWRCTDEGCIRRGTGGLWWETTLGNSAPRIVRHIMGHSLKYVCPVDGCQCIVYFQCDLVHESR